MAGNLEQYEQLTAYLDGELSDADRLEVESLLQRDPEARRLLEELRRTSRLVASLPRGTAPAGLPGSVMARLERRELLGETSVQAKPPTRSSLEWVRPLAVAAGFALLLTASWLSMIHLRSASRPTSPAVLANKSGAPAESAAQSEPPRAEPPEQLAFADKRKGDLDLASSRGRAAARPSAAEQRRSTPAAPSPAALSPAAAPPAARRIVDDAAKPAPRMDSEEIAPNLAGEPSAAVAYTSAGEARVGAERRRPVDRGMTKDEKSQQARGVAGPPEPEFDELLAANVLTNADILHAELGTFVNRVEVVTDDETARKLAVEMGLFLRDSGVPDLRTVTLAEPINPGQPFYFSAPERIPPSSWKDGAGKGEISDAARPAAATCIVVNAPASLVAPMFAASQRFARTRNTGMSWAANGIQVGAADISDREMSSLLLRQLKRGGEPAPNPEMPRLAQTRNGSAAKEAESSLAAKVMARVSKGIRTSDREELHPSGRGRAAGGAGSAGAGRSASPAAPAEAAEDFVTLAISIRASEPTTKPATQEAPGE